MSYGASTKSVAPMVRNPAPRMATMIPNMKSVYKGAGSYPRATMRQSGPVGGGFQSVDGIQVNRAYDPSPINPLP